MTPRFVLGHRPALDGVRAVAIIFVIGFHVLHAVYPEGAYPFSGGFVGVDLFFVLSGFLITALLLQEHQMTGRIRLRAFYTRRALRLFPAQVLPLIGVLAASAGLFAVTGDSSLLRDGGVAIAAVFFYISNWVAAFGWWDLGPLGPMWSLSTEEQFYGLWPIVLMVALSRGVSRRAILIGVIVAAVASAAWRALLFERTGSVDRVYYGLDTRADFLLLGSALALWFSLRGEPQTARARRLLGVSACVGATTLLAFLCFAEYGNGLMFEGLYSVVALACVTVVAQAVVGLSAPFARLLQNPAMLWIGRVSYGMYLWHYLVLYVLAKAGIVDALGVPRLAEAFVLLALVSAGTAAAAATSYYGVERGFLAREPKRAHVEQLAQTGQRLCPAGCGVRGSDPVDVLRLPVGRVPALRPTVT